MKKTFTLAFSILCFALYSASDLTKNFTVGDPGIESIDALSFGPESILFIGDSKTASIVAVDLSGHPSATYESIEYANVDETIAQMLGANPEDVEITDMVVDPTSSNLYFAVNHSSGTPVLLRFDGTSFHPVDLSDLSHSSVKISKAVSKDAKDRRGRSLRKWAVSDLGYSNGQVLVSGLSDAEFASTFTKIAFPFEKDQTFASLEIYHAAHGQYETHAPIKSFLPLSIDGNPSVIAGYTCTPLVVFPMDMMHDGQHVKGQTVAELGNWNTPVDIIHLQNKGQDYILIANTTRALMKINLEDIKTFGTSLSTPLEKRGGTAGVDFIALPFVNVLQLDKLDDTNFVMLQREADGNLALKTGGSRWL